jgi:hypothetical protein
MRFEVDNVGPELIKDSKVVLVRVWVLGVRGRDVLAQTLCHGQRFCPLEVDGENVAHGGMQVECDRERELECAPFAVDV